VVIRNDMVLASRRLPDSRFEPLRWEFPGGKIEFGEGPRECLRRELFEEIGVDADVGPVLDVFNHVYTDGAGTRSVLLIFFRCSIIQGEPSPIGCHEVGWFTRDQLGSLPFVAGDVPMLDRLLREGGAEVRS